ncbi:hypothetical protein ACHHYP_20280, partial [Achlya hypogyna]
AAQLLSQIPTNVAFRGRYLQSKVINRDASRNSQFPKIHHDESNVNQNHVCARSWLDIGRKRYAKEGKGNRLFIVGAGSISGDKSGSLFVYIGVLRTSGDKIYGDWVEESLHYWQSQLKTKKGYHGNFNSELIKMWFHKLCRALAVNFGTCIIHLDGAKYHKRVLNPEPANKWLKVDIQSWLKRRRSRHNTHAWKWPALTVFFTRRRYPELQPIEIIWANVKNRIGANPAKYVEDLGSKLTASLEVEGTLRKVQGFENIYLATADNELLAD